MSDGKVTLDRDVFKALASDTRLDILMKLDDRNMTVSELARALELHKATVHEHVEKLVEVELVDRIEDHRKWVYYRLTWTGRRLLHPERITFAILLSSAVAAGVTGLVAGMLALAARTARVPSNAGANAAASQDLAAGGSPGASAVAATLPSYVPELALGLLVVAGLLTVATWWAHRRVREAEARGPVGGTGA